MNWAGVDGAERVHGELVAQSQLHYTSPHLPMDRFRGLYWHFIFGLCIALWGSRLGTLCRLAGNSFRCVLEFHVIHPGFQNFRRQEVA